MIVKRKLTAGVLGSLAACALVLGGCAGVRVKMLTDNQYAPRADSYKIELYQGSVKTAHEDIAILNSVAVEALTTSTRELLIEDLKSRARRVGADAVVNVVMLTGSVRGWVRDPQTPFRSYKQGWRDRMFLRGRAIRFKPVLIDPGEDGSVGDPFVFAEGERPEAYRPQEPDEIEVYEITDPSGRRGFASRKKQRTTPLPRTPLIDPGG